MLAPPPATTRVVDDLKARCFAYTPQVPDEIAIRALHRATQREPAITENEGLGLLVGAIFTGAASLACLFGLLAIAYGAAEFFIGVLARFHEATR